jgi:DNA modification methylase
VTVATIHHGDCLEVMRSFGDRSIDVVITDPPYSPEVHGKSRAGARTLKMGNGKPSFNREVEFGFDAITQDQMEACADQFERLAKRWVLVFCDAESIHLWRGALRSAGLEPIRIGFWVKEGCTPQFTGDRPAAGVEAIVIAHRKGRKQWNGGGSRAVWTHPVVQRRGSTVNDRVHTTQKPIELMLELVELFSNPGERILDAFAGSGTTGVAAVRLGREFVGIEQQEKYVATARERIEAELSGSDLHALRAGQTALFAKESA